MIEKLSVRETEKLVKNLVSPAKKVKTEKNTAEDAIYESLEEKIERYHGNKGIHSDERKTTKVKLKLNIIPEMNWRGSLICSNLSDRRQNERDF